MFGSHPIFRQRGNWAKNNVEGCLPRGFFTEQDYLYEMQGKGIIAVNFMGWRVYDAEFQGCRT
jgi:hypothetical protein